jgi:apolipoprotein N-acyltransferase
MAYLAAVLSGLLAALSFPTIVAGFQLPNLFWVAWVALIPFLIVLRRQKSLGRAAALSFVFGLSWNAFTSYWIFNALYFNGQLSWVASLGVLLFMGAGLSLLLVVFLLTAQVLSRRFDLPWVLVLPGFWTFYEWVRNYFPFGGYPWANLGYSQASWLTLLQSADLFGVYGITFLLVLVNAVLVEFLLRRRKGRSLAWFPPTAAVLLLLGFVVYGKLRLQHIEVLQNSAPTLKLGLLQPNIGQQMKGQPELNDFIQKLLVKMTREAAAQGVDFVVWPETSLPTALPLYLRSFAPLDHFSVPILLGIVSTDPVPGRSQPILYNSALQVEPGGRFAGRQHKQHLVPLGEYTPMQDLLWFVDPIVHKIGDFRTVYPEKLLQVHGHPYGVVICYEDLFPNLSRDFVRRGADFLVNITNDAWYGDVSQLDQHLNFSRFRAVENRRAVVRGTNTGYTAVLAPTGRIQAEIPKFTRSILLAEIPLNRNLSVYTRWGDWLWIGLLAAAGVLSIVGMRLNKRIKHAGA